MIYMILGLMGGYVHWRRDRKSFWYFGTFMLTLTLVLIYYLNFKYGHSQCLAMGNPSDVACEVRDRDYFFIVAFSAWGVWASLGLVYIWEGIASLFGSDEVKVGREVVEVPRKTSWLASSWILASCVRAVVHELEGGVARGTDRHATPSRTTCSIRSSRTAFSSPPATTTPSRSGMRRRWRAFARTCSCSARRCSTPTGTCASSFAVRFFRTMRRRDRRCIAGASGRCPRGRRCT